MNGQSTVNHPTHHNTEQLIGKFHVVNVDKLPTNPVSNHEDMTNAVGTTGGGGGHQSTAAAAPPPPPPSSIATDESACGSRFQMIRVDRNFGRGRWKVNDYEPPENISTSTNQPVNTTENEPVNNSNASISSTLPTTTILSNVPPGLAGDPNATSSATLTAAAATAAAATATAFQQQQQQLQQQHQQQQQRLAMGNPPGVVQTGNVPPPTGLMHPYPPGSMSNMAGPNQPYILPNHPQFGYYPFFPSPYPPYAAQWAALAAANHYLPPPPMQSHQQQQQASQLPPGNLGDAIRYPDTLPDGTNENPVISSAPFPNQATDHLQSAQMTAPFIYTAHHAHPPYVSQAPPSTVSPYATVASYHPVPQPPTIIPPPTQPLSLTQIIPNNTTDIQQQQSHQGPQTQQQAPILTSPKHDTSTTKNSVQQSVAPKATTANAPTNLTKAANGVSIDTLRNSTTTNHPVQITDLLSSSPSMPNSHPPSSLLSPITVQTNNPNKTPGTSLNEIWSYAANNPSLNLSQTAAQTAVATAAAAMSLLTHENSQNTEIANEILKGLTTPTKQNNTTDIDNKISAAMDLVKMHLLSAVREEVTELRQQIRTLNEKVNNLEHENTFLRQHVPSEIYAQYTPLFIGSSAANDSSNSTTTVTTTAPTVPLSSSQPISTASVTALPVSIVQPHPSLSTTSQVLTSQPPPPSSSINLPPT